MNEELRRSAAHVFVDDLTRPELNHDDRHHLERVMRLRRGEIVSCSDGRGQWCLTQFGEDLQIVGESYQVSPPQQLLTVAVVPVKGDRTELAVEKLVEIGIDRIVILEPTDHSVVRWPSEKRDQMMQRFNRIGRAAAMQSRRVFLAEIVGPLSLDDVLAEDSGASPTVAMAEPGGSREWAGIRTLVIGPEGGFSPSEVSKASRTVDLGGSVLRAETAAIVGASLMVAHQRR